MKLRKFTFPLFLWSILMVSDLSSQSFVRYANESSPINTITINGFYRGCAWVDLDKDGDLDLSLTGYALRNEGQDSFVVIQSFGNPVNGENHILGGVSWADYDNDGDADCLYSFTHLPSGAFTGNTIIYENDGNGAFTEKVIDAGQNLRAWSAAFGAANQDAYIDITGAVAVNFAGLSTPGFFYTGSENGDFTEIDTIEFAQNTAPYTVAYWTDFDQDGDQDLLMASGPGGFAGPDFHYRNLYIETGEEGFSRIDGEPFATTNQDGQCYNIVDYDLDGDQDLFLTNYGGAANRFYENQNGSYVSITNNLVFPGPALGNCWGDFDNDGDQDVIITADNLSLAGYFENQAGTFEKISNPFPADFAGGNVSGLSIGDYDGDGDLDFFANGGISGQNGPRGLYKNELSNDNHWVQIDLEGTSPSNRSAIGAQVRIKTTIAGNDVWLHREVSAQNTFMGHNAQRVHFGLADNSMIDTLEVTWPSNQVELWTNLTADTLYSLTEGIMVHTNEVLDQGQGAIMITPNPSNGEVQMSLPRSLDPGNSEIQIFDPAGRQVVSQPADTSAINLQLKHLTSGTYFIRWRTGADQYTGKLIIQH